MSEYIKMLALTQAGAKLVPSLRSRHNISLAFNLFRPLTPSTRNGTQDQLTCQWHSLAETCELETKSPMC